MEMFFFFLNVISILTLNFVRSLIDKKKEGSPIKFEHYDEEMMMKINNNI